MIIWVVSPPPQRPMTTDFEGFLSQIVSITFVPILILQKDNAHLNTLTCAPILGKRVNKYLQRSYPDSDRYGTNV